MPVPRSKAARGKAGKSRRAAVAAAAAAVAPSSSAPTGDGGGSASPAGGRRGKRPPAPAVGGAATSGGAPAAMATVAPKRGRGADGRPPPAATGAAEEDDGLEYEDPYGDDFESGSSDGELNDGGGDGGVGATMGGSSNRGSAAPAATLTRVFRPGVDELPEGETLVCDPSVYEVRVGLTLEWPALSFDLVSAGTGGGYPLDLTLIAGTQANSPGANALVALRLCGIHRNRRARPGRLRDGDGEGDDEADDTDSDSDGSDSGADDIGGGGERVRGPVLSSQRVPFDGTVNRVRVCPHASGIVAAWSDTGRVAIHDLSSPLAKLTASTANARVGLTAAAKGVREGRREPADPVADYRGHGVEGYALAWSPLVAGRLASGDVNGCIRLWEAEAADGVGSSSSGGGGGGGGGSRSTAGLDSFGVVAGGAYRGHAQNSVEDIVWSPVEASVFASASTDGSVRVWDVRSPRRVPAVGIERAHDTDVNVLGWNSVDTHLLVSGGDEGALRVWDLRALVPGAGAGGAGYGGASPAAAADFAVHRKPITAVEWHPTDSSVLAAASEDGTSSVWDLAVERDAEEELRDGTVLQGADEYPPQLLFVHAGQKNVKELHWGGGGRGGASSSLSGVGGVILTSAEDGLNVWKAADIS
ncbi:hypothetical protein MMPV_000457 [Pyropia vietnamensis]